MEVTSSEVRASRLALKLSSVQLQAALLMVTIERGSLAINFSYAVPQKQTATMDNVESDLDSECLLSNACVHNYACLSYDPYGPVRTFIAKLLRKFLYEGCTQ